MNSHADSYSGLSERAKHPRERLYGLHGSLLDIKCTNKSCDVYEKEKTKGPLSSALVSNFDAPSFSSKPISDVEDINSKLSSMDLKEDKKPT